MPGPAMHYVIGQLLTNPEMQLHPDKAQSNHPTLPADVRRQLNDNPIAFSLGTTGPDFLFFNSADWPLGGNVLGGMMNKMVDKIVELRDQAGSAIPMLERTVDLKGEAERAIDAGRDASATFDEIATTLGNLNRLLELMTGTIKTGLQDLATSNLNVFGLLSNPITACDPEDTWWWFDVLHYAKSGKFANQLLRNSRGNAQAHAYAVGYLSHVTADSVGHPYVNNVVRGPYRNHSQRHKVVENFQDVALYGDWYRQNQGQMTSEQRARLVGEEFVTSELARLFRYNRDAGHLTERQQLRRTDTIISQLLPDIANVELPDSIANLISTSANQTYGQDFGQAISTREVKDAYRMWYNWFAKSTIEGILPTSLDSLPPLDESIKDWFDDLKDQLERTAQAWRDVFSGRPGSGFSFNGVKNFFKKLGRAIAETARLAQELIDKIAATINTIPLRVLNWGLNALYQQFYKLYDYFRLSVSLNGFAFPAARHLNDPRVRHMTQPQTHADANRNALRNVHFSYPLRPVDVGGVFRSAPQEAHLVYPPVTVESDQITEAPNTYRHEGPAYYADGPVRFNPRVVDRLATTERPLSRAEAEQEQLGNACALTAHYYDRFREDQPLPDLNLDGDRGIATPCWSVTNCATDATASRVIPNYTDQKV